METIEKKYSKKKLRSLILIAIAIPIVIIGGGIFLDKRLPDPHAKVKVDPNSIADEKYHLLVETAKKLFSQKDYKGAKELYLEVLKLKPNDTYANEQNLLCEKEINKNVTPESPNNKYGDIITHANKYFDARNYAKAKIKYNEALGINPDDEYSSGRIQFIDSILNQEKEIKNQEQDYIKELNKAKQLFTNRQYTQAEEAFKKILQTKPNDGYSKEQIGLCEIELKKEEEANNLNKEYLNAKEIADNFFNNKQYSKAKDAYKKLSDLKPDDQYSKAQIQSCIDEIKKEEEKIKIDNEYNKTIKEADKLFDDKKYKEAKDAYEKALKIKPGEEHPIKQINKCNQQEKSEAKVPENPVTPNEYRNPKYADLNKIGTIIIDSTKIPKNGVPVREFPTDSAKSNILIQDPKYQAAFTARSRGKYKIKEVNKEYHWYLIKEGWIFGYYLIIKDLKKKTS